MHRSYGTSDSVIYQFFSEESYYVNLFTVKRSGHYYLLHSSNYTLGIWLCQVIYWWVGEMDQVARLNLLISRWDCSSVTFYSLNLALTVEILRLDFTTILHFDFGILQFNPSVHFDFGILCLSVLMDLEK